MEQKVAISENFLSQATTTLKSIEESLSSLAQAALIESSRLANRENGKLTVEGELNVPLQQISQHLLRLSERSQFLRKSLVDDTLDLSLIDDTYWPQIRILQSQEEERSQLARELEDRVGQLLANAIFELASCRHLLTDEQVSVSDGLDALQDELEEGLADIRHFITNLEPTTVLNNFGLGGGVRRYLEQYQTRTKLDTELHIKANIGRLPTIIETAIFRILQEALSNIHRHANATKVDVVIEEKSGALQFSVIDNGDGLISKNIGTEKRNLGLARMVDYAELLNGKLRILSEPEQGTQVILTVPYLSY